MSKNNGRYSVSQNFLTSRKTINRLISKTNISKEDCILEIGTGKAHITRQLAGISKRVITYEIDSNLHQKYAGSLPPNVTAINRDFLKANLPKTPYKIFANIPFCKTTEIIRKLTQAENAADEIWLIVEKGAAKRFCGNPNESTDSLLIKPFFNIEICAHLKREDFHPAPGVDTVLLHLSKKAQPDIAAHERKAYERFIRHSRKYGVCGSKAYLTKRQVSMSLKLANLPHAERSETMKYVQWLCLFRTYAKFNMK